MSLVLLLSFISQKSGQKVLTGQQTWVNEEEKRRVKKTEEDFVPGFQGRTGDVKNNGNRES